MHHRSVAAVTALVGVGVLMATTMTGCGSSAVTASGSGVGMAVTTAGTSTPGTPGTPSTPGTSAPPGTADPSPPCAAVDAKIVPLPGAAAGTTFSNLVVVNRGSAACTLPGQPELRYLGASRQPITVAFSSDPSLPSYLLAPGASAAMAIAYSSDDNPPCDVKIAYVRVTPPGTDLAFDGKTHCGHDGTYEENWVAGSYAAPH